MEEFRKQAGTVLYQAKRALGINAGKVLAWTPPKSGEQIAEEKVRKELGIKK